MPKTISYLVVMALTSIFCSTVLHADDPQVTTESRLRDALKNTMLQLRDVQNQLATAQTAQAQSDKDKADLQAKVDALGGQIKTLTDQAASDKATSEKAIADQNTQIADLTGQLGRVNEALKQWKDAYNQVAQLANSKEAERAKLAVQSASLQLLADDRERKNFALYKVGNEILTRYEQFGLGDAISAKEPFVGITRVKLENLVQDYKDKLLDQAITSGQPAPVPPVSGSVSAGSSAKPKSSASAKP